MKRRDFLRRLGIGAAAVVAMPVVLGKEKECYNGSKINSLVEDERMKWDEVHYYFKESELPLFRTYEEMRVNDTFSAFNKDFAVTYIDETSRTVCCKVI